MHEVSHDGYPTSMRTVTKLLGPLFGVLGGVVASAAFGRIWKHITGDDEAPDARDPDASWSDILIAAAIEGAVFGLVKATIDRASSGAAEHSGDDG